MVLSIPFARYSELLVEKRDVFYTPPAFSAPQGVTPSECRDDV